MTAALALDPIYRRRRFPAEAIELCVRWYLTAQLPRPGGHDGRARHLRVAHDDPAMGSEICPRVRESVGPPCAAGQPFLAHG